MQKHRVNVREDKEKNLVSATFELPSVRDNLLTVSGESKSDSESDGSWYLIRGRHFGRFSRSFPVPEGVKVCGFRCCASIPPYPMFYVPSPRISRRQRRMVS